MFVFPLLSLALDPDPAPSDSLNIMLLMEELIKPSHLVFYLTGLGQRFGLCVSVVHTTASLFQNIIELPSVWNGVSLLLLTWTLNLWCVLKSA